MAPVSGHLNSCGRRLFERRLWPITLLTGHTQLFRPRLVPLCFPSRGVRVGRFAGRGGRPYLSATKKDVVLAGLERCHALTGRGSVKDTRHPSALTLNRRGRGQNRTEVVRNRESQQHTVAFCCHSDR